MHVLCDVSLHTLPHVLFNFFKTEAGQGPVDTAPPSWQHSVLRDCDRS